MKVGVIHGRFQPLHVGHMEYLLAGKARCDLLVVGITNPDPWQVKVETTNVLRSEPAANPCTYYERYLMVEGALLDSGIAHGGFRIVPFPHSFPERLRHYAPLEAEYFLTIYDHWGEAKLQRFQELRLRTHVLWRRTSTVTSGSAVRQLIAAGEAWTHLVPPATAQVIEEFGIAERIRELMHEEQDQVRLVSEVATQAGK
jgi:nicotinamide-nucleotide adenylyltransferase/phosphinothricin biosynthesis protein PhpF